MNRFADWGNALYSGRISYPFIQRWRWWFALAALLLAAALLLWPGLPGFWAVLAP